MKWQDGAAGSWHGSMAWLDYGQSESLVGRASRIPWITLNELSAYLGVTFTYLLLEYKHQMDWMDDCLTP